MASPGDPVPSFSDALTLLLRSASAQLRRSVRRSDRPVAAAAASTSRSTAPSPRRRLPLRQLLTCIALLLAIFGTTAGLTWWSWQTLQDRQVQLGGERELRSKNQSRSLVDDLVKKQEDRGLEAPVAQQKSGQSSLDRSAPSLPSPRGKSVSLDGRVVALLVIAVAVAAATGASWLVVRRFRRRAAAAAAAPVADRCLDRRPADEPDVKERPEPAAAQVEPELSAAVPAGDLSGAVPSGEPSVAVPSGEPSVAALLVEQRRPDPQEGQPAGLLPEPVGAPAIGLAVPQDRTDPLPSSTVPAEKPAAPAGASWPTDAAEPVEPAGYDLADEEAARERIFDRRAARRVSYVQPAWLWWGERNAPVTVQDLSLTGLRFLFSGPSGSSVQAPGLGDPVRVFFPVSGSTVKAAAKVLWKEQTPQGMQMGVDFDDLPADDVARLRELLLTIG
jgi:hypothetical protein